VKRKEVNRSFKGANQEGVNAAFGMAGAVPKLVDNAIGKSGCWTNHVNCLDAFPDIPQQITRGQAIKMANPAFPAPSSSLKMVVPKPIRQIRNWKVK